MSGKRKRVGISSSESIANGKQPMSAIAAARLRVQVAGQDIATPETIHKRPPTPSHSPLESAGSTRETSTSDVEEGESERAAHGARTFKLCNWRDNPDDILSDTDFELVINLPKHETIALVGCFDFNVIKGAININGANIGPFGPKGKQNQTYRTFVPATHPILKLRGLDDTNHVRFVTCELPAPLARINPLFANIWHIQSNNVDSRSFNVITESSTDQLSRELCPEGIPENWPRAIETCTASPSITFIAGSPGSGKSMFARRLVNRYLTGLGKTALPVPVAFFLDLDPGQQEYMPVSQISLIAVRDLNLGPEFTHPAVIPGLIQSSGNELIRAHPVPVNLAAYVEFYYKCIEDLFETYNNMRSHHPLAPLVIKTSGLIYNSNFDILSKSLTQIKPDNIVHLDDSPPANHEYTIKSCAFRAVVSQYRGTYHNITARESTINLTRSESEINIMQMQSYFHLNSRKPGSRHQYDLTWTSRPLSTTVPWEFCYQETNNRKQDIVGFAMYTEPVEPDSMIHILNGSIIHILTSTSSIVLDAYTKLPRADKYQIPYFPKSQRSDNTSIIDPRASNFMCMAIIRGFDLERKIVQVLVPSTHEDLLHKLAPAETVFVYGCCDTPEWAFVEEKYAGMHLISDRNSSPMGNICMWVDGQSSDLQMGYLNTLRRVRKFQS